MKEIKDMVLDTPTMKLKRFYKKISIYLKLALLISLLILTFLVADKLAVVILATTKEMLARIINVILVAVIVYMFKRK